MTKPYKRTAAILFVALVLFTIGSVCLKILNALRAVRTEDNEELVCFEFQKLIVVSHSAAHIEQELGQRLHARFGGDAFDGWGQKLAIKYRSDQTGIELQVISAGPDMTFGTADDTILTRRFGSDGAVVSDDFNPGKPIR
jgi:hypothetical protein